jgi:hypothetical protein
LLDLVGHHAEAPAGLTGPGRLDGRVQREQIGLPGQLRDQGVDRRDLTDRRLQGPYLVRRRGGRVLARRRTPGRVARPSGDVVDGTGERGEGGVDRRDGAQRGPGLVADGQGVGREPLGADCRLGRADPVRLGRTGRGLLLGVRGGGALPLGGLGQGLVLAFGLLGEMPEDDDAGHRRRAPTCGACRTPGAGSAGPGCRGAAPR